MKATTNVERTSKIIIAANIFKFLRSRSRRCGTTAARRLRQIQNANHISQYNLWVALENHNLVGRILQRVMKLRHQLRLRHLLVVKIDQMLGGVRDDDAFGFLGGGGL